MTNEHEFSTTSTTSLSALPLAGVLEQGLSWVVTSMQSGPLGILALSAVTWSVVLPLTVYKRIWGIGVAYGFSVFAAGLAMFNIMLEGTATVAGSSGLLLTQACMFYGLRLGSYLLLREAVRGRPVTVENGTVTSRILFSYSVALFYAFMTAPVLYAIRHPVVSKIAMGGAYLAWFGAIVEAIADFQKLAVKQKQKATNSDDDKRFVGPKSGVYRISRHPNYMGEVLFWTGLFVGGAPSFGSSIVAWVCSGLGLFGIVSIMLGATSRLEKRHSENYGSDEAYKTWKNQVPYSLIPFLK